MFVKPRRKSQLDIEIEIKLDELRMNTNDDEEYDKILAQLERLYKMKEKERPNRVSADTWALIGANLLGILIIITHEYTNPITTKAVNFAIKPR
jgi:hypothetical protein